jgi:glycerophosphoryl diester phosphodiesterase
MTRLLRLSAASVLSLLSLTAVAAAQPEPGCLVIAHRGASGYAPEHTLAAYRLAILLGAHYIEPDLVWTQDGVPIARHENQLDGTTDVADRPEFAARRTQRVIDGREREGWFSEDFTLAELKTLRARERLPRLRPANTPYDGLFTVPTLQEVLDLVRDMEAVLGRRIGLYPELKAPAYFRSLDLEPEVRLVEILAENGYAEATDPVYIQSFDAESLQRLDKLTPLRLVLLMWRNPQTPEQADRWISDAGLSAIAKYADGIGVEKYGFLIPRDDNQRLATSAATDLPARARRAGLKVHAWTFRAENEFLPADLRQGSDPAARGNSLAEHRAFIAAGIDGLFSDQPDVAREACRAAGAG